MDEYLNEEFTIRLDKILQTEYDRFVSETGNRILSAVNAAKAAGKKKATGKLFVSPFELPNAPAFCWQIAQEHLPVIWDAVTAEHRLAVVDELVGHYDLSLAESQTGKSAWFALRDLYSNAPTHTFARFSFAIRDYLKEYGVRVDCKPCRKHPHATKIKFIWKQN